MQKKLDKLLKELINLHPKYIDLSLDRLLKLLKKLGDPHLNIPLTIHIAGTNGKGSTLSYIKQILFEHGFLVHTYVSPHLKNFNERIYLSNNIIDTKKLLETLRYIKKINKDDPITFFEITTAAAFYLYSKEKADFLIIETGLGGRLDATNVIKKSFLAIITSIGIDHKEFLGNDILKIANEKLGIIKKDSHIIIAKQKRKVEIHIKNKLKKFNNDKLIFNKDFKIININKKDFTLRLNNKHIIYRKPKLIGDHQIENASTAIAAIFKLSEFGYSFDQKKINRGISKTVWPGRLERRKLNKIPVFLDGAHNEDGAKKILQYFKNKNLKVWLMIGMLNNKDLYKFIKILKPIIEGLIAIKIPEEENAYTVGEILEVSKKLKLKNYNKNSIEEANFFLIKEIKPKIILITGSLYLVGKVRDMYL